MAMTAGGWTFVGTTLGIAALNGALLPLIGAAGAGYVACKAIKTMTSRSVDSIYEKTERDMRARVEAIPDKEVRSREEKQLRKDLATLQKTREKDDIGRNEAAKLMGVGVFAFPAAAVVAGAAYIASGAGKRK